MFIALPLTLIGIGLLIYQIFAGVTLALPIGAGLLAGFGASALGFAAIPSLAIGTAVFMTIIALGRFAALTSTALHTKAAVVALFAIPAGITGYSAANAIASLLGFSGIVIAPVATLICAAVAVQRLVRPIA